MQPKKSIMVKSIYALLSAKKLPKNPLPNLAKKRTWLSCNTVLLKMTKISTHLQDSLQKKYPGIKIKIGICTTKIAQIYSYVFLFYANNVLMPGAVSCYVLPIWRRIMHNNQISICSYTKYQPGVTSQRNMKKKY